jgi:hypothetical protein
MQVPACMNRNLGCWAISEQPKKFPKPDGKACAQSLTVSYSRVREIASRTPPSFNLMFVQI